MTFYICCSICSLKIIMSSLNSNMLSSQAAPLADVLLQDWKSFFEFSYYSTRGPSIQLKVSGADMGKMALWGNGKSFLPEPLKSFCCNSCFGISHCHQHLQSLSVLQVKPILTSTSRNKMDFNWKGHRNRTWNTWNSVLKPLNTFNRVKSTAYSNFILFLHFHKFGSESIFLMLAIFREFCYDPVFWHI